VERKIENVSITAANRLQNSASGNPRWRLHTSIGEFFTETDASLGHAITNLQNAEHADTYAIGAGAAPVTLLVRDNGLATKVYGIERDGVALR
jgi:hypothetical protein